MTPSTWVAIKTPPCRLYDRGEIEGPAFVTSDGEQVYWVKFYIAPGRTPVLMFGETEIKEISERELNPTSQNLLPLAGLALAG